MINHKIKTTREKLGYTQADLAEQTNLSIRTIQRVESGHTQPKGHTLTVLAKALGMDTTEFHESHPKATSLSSTQDLKVKLINLSTLCFIGIPFGNILIPFLIWNKSKEGPKVDEIGRRIINFQIIWTVCTALLLIISPFLQTYMPTGFTLILMVGFLAIGINVFFIFKTAYALMRQQYDVLPLSFRLI